MKANEAPEKIYITPQALTNGFSRRWFEEPFKRECIEYVLKDASIKKAVEYIDGLIEFLNEYGHQLKKERIIEGFKKYMEEI